LSAILFESSVLMVLKFSYENISVLQTLVLLTIISLLITFGPSAASLHQFAVNLHQSAANLHQSSDNLHQSMVNLCF
jgi:hypothetical protein